jgi:heavy metal sensor kinase
MSTEYAPTQRFSLRARTTSWYSGLLAVALTIFSIAIYIGIRTYLKQTLQRGLSGTVHTIADSLLTKVDSKGDAWVLGEMRESYDTTPVDHYIRLSTGNRVLFATADMREPAVRLTSVKLPRLSDVGAFHRQTSDGAVVMTYALPFQARDGRVFEIEAGTSLTAMQLTLNSLAKILAVGTFSILAAAILGGYYLMKVPLRPLVVLTDKAEGIGHKHLGERLPVIPTGDELERLSHALNRMIDRLEEALAHNHRFSADASHELRTPLTILRGEMEEMLTFDDLPPLVVDNLVSAIEEVERMSRIVNSLMAITRLDAGGERMNTEVVDLSALVRTTMEHMRLIAEEKNLPLTLASERGAWVLADPLRMKQVLVNLIDNAIKYTPAHAEGGDMEPEGGGVSVNVFTAEAHVHLTITDHGIGISPEALPHIFERFYRADYARSRVAGGVGLGLAIVKSIVTAHDGTVSITSNTGKGSTVRVLLPLVKAPENGGGEPQNPSLPQRTI